MSEIILEMYRPIRNFGEASTHTLRTELTQLGITNSQIKILGARASKAAILGTGDLGGFFDYIEIDAETAKANIGDLSEYLENICRTLATMTSPFPPFPWENIYRFKGALRAMRVCSP